MPTPGPLAPAQFAGASPIPEGSSCRHPWPLAPTDPLRGSTASRHVSPRQSLEKGKCLLPEVQGPCHTVPAVTWTPTLKPQAHPSRSDTSAAWEGPRLLWAPEARAGGWRGHSLRAAAACAKVAGARAAGLVLRSQGPESHTVPDPQELVCVFCQHSPSERKTETCGTRPKAPPPPASHARGPWHGQLGLGRSVAEWFGPPGSPAGSPEHTLRTAVSSLNPPG